MERGEPLVGRTAELAILTSLRERACGGAGQVVLVVGPAGIGKTALVRQGLAVPPDPDPAAPRARLIAASGDPDERSLSGGLLDQLALAAQVAESIGPAAGAPEARKLRDLLRGGPSDPLLAGSALLAMVEAMTAARRPVVLIADDAHWADELSLRAASFAIRRLRAAPVLCVVITRPENLAALPSGLRRAVDDRGTRLDVGPLSTPEVARLAELCGAGPLPRRAAQRLRDHAAGVPLHVKELLHDLPGDVLRTPGAVLPAPRSLETLVLSRLASCAPETEQLVVAAAVLGTSSRLTDAAALAGLADPLPALQEAVRQRLLDAAGAGERRCVFARALIRAAVYRDIGVSRRAELHRAAARLATGAVALGHRAAGCRAWDAALAADLHAHALAALAAGRRVEAAEDLLTSVQVDGPGPDRDRRLLAAIETLADLGDAARARTYAAEVEAMPPSAPRSVVLSRLAMLAGDVGRAEERLGDAWALLGTAAQPGAALPGGEGPGGELPGTGSAADPAAAQLREGTAVAACQLALMLIGQRRADAAARWAQRACATAQTSFTRACSRAVHGGSLISAGRVAEARDLLEAALVRQGHEPGAALIRVSLAAALQRCDDLEGARAHLATARGGELAGLPMWHQLEADLVVLSVDYRSGRWERAAAEAERLVTLIDDLDQGWLLPRAHLLAVYVAAGRGHWAQAVAHAEAAAAPGPAGPGTSPVDLADARVALSVARGDQAGILAAVQPLGDLSRLARLDPARLTFWPAYAGALAREGRAEAADGLLRQFEELASARQRRSVLAAAARARGSLEALRHRPDAARAAFLASLDALCGLGMPYEEGLTRLEFGRFLRRAGQRRSAVRELSAARLLFVGLGARPFLEQCDTELGQEPAAAPSAARLPLTSRQLAVARAVASGKSNRDVARELFISLKTVEFHVNQILVRLGVDSRGEIAAMLAAARAGSGPPVGGPAGGGAGEGTRRKAAQPAASPPR